MSTIDDRPQGRRGDPAPGRGSRARADADLKLTAQHLARMGVVDEVMDELAADAGARLRASIRTALLTAVPSDRDRRIDTVTQRALAR